MLPIGSYLRQIELKVQNHLVQVQKVLIRQIYFKS